MGCKMVRESDWIISDSNTTEDGIIQNGNRMFCGNGFMGYRGTVDEADSSDVDRISLAFAG